MSTTTQSGTPATLPAGVVLALDVVGTPAAPTTGDGIPYSKLDIGVPGASSPVTTANPLPVTNASLPLPAGASTSAAQTTANASLSSLDTKTPALGQALAAFSVPVVLTAAQLATLTPFSSVSVSNFPASQAVTGTFWQATQPVSNASLPLPANAAQEAGGNLDTLVARTVLGQALMQSGLPVTLASDQQTMESHVQRDLAEQAWLLKLDAASLASRGHGYERATLSDRRGRTTRGTSR